MHGCPCNTGAPQYQEPDVSFGHDAELLAKLRVDFAKSTTRKEAVIIAALVLAIFGDEWMVAEQENGWPCPMLRMTARIWSAA